MSVLFLIIADSRLFAISQGNYQPTAAVTNGNVVTVVLSLVPSLPKVTHQTDLLQALSSLAESIAQRARSSVGTSALPAVPTHYAVSLSPISFLCKASLMLSLTI